MTKRTALQDDVLDLQFTLMRYNMPHQAASMMELNLTPQQLMLLMMLRENETVPTAVCAGSLGAKPNVVTGIVQRLVERGFVHREEDASDRRVRLLRLTHEGAEFSDNLMEGIREHKREALSALTDEQLAQYSVILATLAEANRKQHEAAHQHAVSDEAALTF